MTDFSIKQQTNDWHKRGELPPAGTECEALVLAKWVKVFVIGLDFDGYAVCHFYESGIGYRGYNTPSMFRPSMTDNPITQRERVASELVDVMMAVPVSDRKTASESYMSMALAIYDHLHKESKS